MSNTDKLLRAFIEASGYEIEEVESMELYRTIPFLGQTESDMLHFNDGCIISRAQTDTDNHWELYQKVIDYKVTKKKPQACFDVDSPEWSCIVDFVLSHKEDITNDINDYGGLGKILDYFYRGLNDNT